MRRPDSHRPTLPCMADKNRIIATLTCRAAQRLVAPRYGSTCPAYRRNAPTSPVWRRWRGSNPLFLVLETSALPSRPHPRIKPLHWPALQRLVQTRIDSQYPAMPFPDVPIRDPHCAARPYTAPHCYSINTNCVCSPILYVLVFGSARRFHFFRASCLLMCDAILQSQRGHITPHVSPISLAHSMTLSLAQNGHGLSSSSMSVSLAADCPD